MKRRRDMDIGYVRVSSDTQNTIRQEELMKTLGVEKVFIDVCSGKNRDRTQLKAMLEFVREGDTVVVESISRLARNTRDLLTIVDDLKAKNVALKSIKEAFDTSTQNGRLVLTLFGAIFEMERDYIRERQREGIEIKKAQGGYKGRKPIEVDKDKWNEVMKLWHSREITATEAMKRLGLKRNTFYRRVQDMGGENKNGV